MLQLILFNNFVEYDGQIYRQMQGTAMGTPVAPSYANLYLHFKFEQVLEKYQTDIQFYRRYIDDGFAIMKSKSIAEKLIQELNSCSKMTLTHEVSSHYAVFLDFFIYKGERFIQKKQLDFRPYFKPTNRFLYLHGRSNHPLHMKLSIVRGEAIRCLRSSSNKIVWLQAMHKIFKGLITRGYDGKDIQRKWRAIRWEHRSKWLNNDSVEATKPDGILLTIRYHPKTAALWKSLIQLHSLPRQLRPKRMKFNTQQKAVIDAWPPKLVFKDFRKIGHCLVNSKHTGKNEQDQRRPFLAKQHTKNSSPLNRKK